MLRDVVGRVTGSRVVLLVGSGDNGGDALYAGARLAARGARVDALLVADRHHEAGAAALRPGRRSGAARSTTSSPPRSSSPQADLVLDGILGIGGRGALRERGGGARGRRAGDRRARARGRPAARRRRRHRRRGRRRRGRARRPHRGVRGAEARAARRRGIGVRRRPRGGRHRPRPATTSTRRVPRARRRPARRRGAAAPARATTTSTRAAWSGCATGSARYPGAGLLSTGGARAGLAGYVRYTRTGAPAGRRDLARRRRAPPGGVAEAGRAQCWVVGSGRGTDDDARARGARRRRARRPAGARRRRAHDPRRRRRPCAHAVARAHGGHAAHPARRRVRRG